MGTTTRWKAAGALAGVTALSALLIGCGGDDGGAGGRGTTVVVTTTILGDVVEQVVGDQVDVVTVMSRGASPHDFQVSARQAQTVLEADILVVNGGGFEAGLDDLIEQAAASGVPTFVALAAVEARHADDGGGHDGHDHGSDDPHFFTDPALMSDAVEHLGEFLLEHLPQLDAAALTSRVAAYQDELARLDDAIAAMVAEIPDDTRVLVTSHDVFGYFAERYRFEVVGTIIPSSTFDGGSAGDLVALAELIEDRSVPAIFTDATSRGRLADTLAGEVGDVEVVELFSESLGEEGSGAETYVGMMRTNARRIADALR